MTLINDARLSNGKSTIGESYSLSGSSALIFMTSGFINPLVCKCFRPVDHVVTSVQIYDSDFSFAFHDITIGSNPGCGE